MNLSTIPRHIWWGVVLPIVLVGLGVWRLWPLVENYRAEDEKEAIQGLETIWLTSRPYALLRDYAYLLFDPDDEEYAKFTFCTSNVAGMLGDKLTPELRRLAEADAVPLNPISPQPVAFHGYFFLAMEGNNRSFCAYPAEYDWRHKHTFIIKSFKVIYSIDNGGKPISEWPMANERAERFSVAWEYPGLRSFY